MMWISDNRGENAHCEFEVICGGLFSLLHYRYLILLGSKNNFDELTFITPSS